MTPVPGKAILKVGRQEFAGARKVIAMTGGGVFRLSDGIGRLLAAAIAVAENQYGYATGEEREKRCFDGSGPKGGDSCRKDVAGAQAPNELAFKGGAP